MKSSKEYTRCVRAATLALALCGLLTEFARGQDDGPARTVGSVAQEENGEVREVRRRLRVMRGAVEVFVEKDQHDRAELVERAMAARQLNLEGRRDAEADQVRESAPNRGQLAELLAVAAKLVADRGDQEQAESLAALSKIYANQHLRRQRSGNPEREGREERRTAGLDSLERRVRILDLARAAHAEAGRERNAESLKRTVHYGMRLLEGADLTDSDAAGVPGQGNLAELLLVAAELYATWGQAEREHACRSLAEYYREQLREERRESGGDGREHEEREHEEREHGEREHGEREHGEREHGEREHGEREHGEREHGERGHEQHAREEQRTDARPGGIHELAVRIDIVRQARAAWVEAGRERQAGQLEQFLRVAELQQGGASGEAVRQAFDGLSMGNIIELLQGAHNLWAEWGYEHRAERCHQLAEFYVRRERDRPPEGRLDPIEEILQRIEQMQEELQDLKTALRQLRDR